MQKQIIMAKILDKEHSNPPYCEVWVDDEDGSVHTIHRDFGFGKNRKYPKSNEDI